MNRPNQSIPVARHVSASAMGKMRAVGPSNIACDICHIGCNLLPEPAKSLATWPATPCAETHGSCRTCL